MILPDREQLDAAMKPLLEMGQQAGALIAEAVNAFAAAFLEQIDWQAATRALLDVQQILESGGRDPATWRIIKRKRIRRAQWRKRK